VSHRHHVLFALVAGLLAGGWVSPAVLPLAAAAALLAPERAGVSRRAVAIAAALAVLGGAAIAEARRDAIDHGRLPARTGGFAHGEATLLERFRTRASGEHVAAARWRGGWADGERVLLKRRSAVPAAAAGAVVAVTGIVRPLEEYEALQRRRGAVAALDLKTIRATGGRRGGLAGRLDSIRMRAETALGRSVRPSDAALLRGLVLGEDEAIAADVRDDFQVSGLAHILAVSGTNVMLLATLVLAGGALVGAPLRWRLAVALVMVALYVPLAGGGASIQRAGVMGAAGLVAALAGRPSSRWYALGLAAAVTLALNPYAAAEPGWQLSFAAVMGLLWLAPPMREHPRLRRWPGWLAEAASMTVAATVTTAPLLALHFGRVSLVSLPANLVAAPVVAPIMWLGMLSAALGQVAAALAVPLNVVNAGLVGFLAWLAHVAARAPLAAVSVPVPVVLGVYLAALLLYLRRRRIAARWWRWRDGRIARPRRTVRWALPREWRSAAAATAAAAALAVVLLLPGGPAPPRPGETVVSFLDIGQGDATLVQRDGASLLVDTGPPDGHVVDRLREAGVDRLDVLMITHAQLDHEGAAPEVVARLNPRLVLDGGAGWPTAVQHALAGRRLITPFAGQTLALGALRLRVLWPPRELMEAPPAGDPNNRAVVAHVQSGDFDLLLPADAESDVTAALDLPRVEALKVAHHGSADAGLPGLLERLRPAVAAIEVGRGNTYGHPRASTLAALRVVPRVYRTDRDGTVRLRVLGGRMTIEHGVRAR
jgi:competence protein ComEC